MDLKLAITSACTETGCQVQFLDTLDADEPVDARYSRLVVENEIAIRPGHLVAIDTSTSPPRIVFRWGLTMVTRIEGERIYADGSKGKGRFLTLAEGLEVDIAVGDLVFIALGKIYALCVDGMPAPLDVLRAQAFPQIRAMYQQTE